MHIVGYVNVVAPAGQFVMVANPLTTGDDVLTNVIHGVSGGSSLYYWTGSTWATYTYSALGGGHWKSGSDTVDNALISPGTAFFINASTTFTNSFVGSVVGEGAGSIVTNALPVDYAPVGALIPYGDVVTNTATFNLNVAGGSTLLKWDQENQIFQPAFTYSALQHVWKQGATTTNPVINVGEGFFISSSTATNWIQALP